MKVETVAEEYVGDVVGDFSSLAAILPAWMRNGGVQAIWPPCSLSEMFGYATDLRSMTSGRAPSRWNS